MSLRGNRPRIFVSLCGFFPFFLSFGTEQGAQRFFFFVCVSRRFDFCFILSLWTFTFSPLFCELWFREERGFCLVFSEIVARDLELCLSMECGAQLDISDLLFGHTCRSMRRDEVCLLCIRPDDRTTIQCTCIVSLFPCFIVQSQGIWLAVWIRRKV